MWTDNRTLRDAELTAENSAEADAHVDEILCYYVPERSSTEIMRHILSLMKLTCSQLLNEPLHMEAFGGRTSRGLVLANARATAYYVMSQLLPLRLAS